VSAIGCVMDIAIVGAGIGGLCAARALIRVGHQVRVIEAVEELRPVGAGLLLQPNAIRVLDALELRGQAEARGALLRLGRVTRADGKVLQRVDLTFGGKRPAGLGIHRGLLQELLLEVLPEGTVDLGRRAVGLDSAGVVLADGARIGADVIVGADGIHSAVAESLGCPPLRYAGYTCWRGVADEVDFTFHRLEPDALTEVWGAGRRFGIVPIGVKTVYWFATDNRPADTACAPEEARDELLGLFAGFPEPVSRLIEATDGRAILQNDIIDRPARREWGRGRVTLLGDAAHPMTPNLGQGACQAAEDAVCLARHLEGATAAEAQTRLRAYEAERIPRTNKIVAASYAMGRLGQLEGVIPRLLRDVAVAWTPGFVTERQVIAMTG